jgi:hypothetical protein
MKGPADDNPAAEFGSPPCSMRDADDPCMAS